MKEYFKYFKWVYLVLGVLAVFFFLIKGLHAFEANVEYYERTNKECLTTKRVFDNADVLSDKEEQKLEELIAKREKQTSCDIVLVTLDEPLKDYARAIDPSAPSYEYVRVYAEQFWETNGFGYDKPDGDGVILVDNWSRADDGMIHTWFCTTGIVQTAYSDADIDHILDRVYRYVEKNPYRAYKTYVNDFYDDMKGSRMFHVDVWGGIPILIGIIASVIFIAMNWKSRSGQVTTTSVTYVRGRNPQFVNRQDIFIRKNVVQHRIETSSSSGGGGGHSGGGGGGHHGGGGHSR